MDDIYAKTYLHMGFDPPISAKLHSQFIFRCTVYSNFKLLFKVKFKAGF